jgi:hypothetical protein
MNLSCASNLEFAFWLLSSSWTWAMQGQGGCVHVGLRLSALSIWAQLGACSGGFFVCFFAIGMLGSAHLMLGCRSIGCFFAGESK